jgi:hydrogenase maturation protease
MANALIIGYGNPLRGDDGLGWHAVRLLANVTAARDAETMTCHQLAPELAQPVSEARVVVFVDAAREGPPGRLDWRRVEAQTEPASFTHHLSPESLLGMARELYDRCPPAFIVSVAGGNFKCGEELSPPVRAALPTVVKLVDNLLAGKA